MPRSPCHPQSRTDLQTTIPPASALPLTHRRPPPAAPTATPPLLRPPSLRSGSRLAAAPPPGSATLPQDRERPVNTTLDYIPRPCYPRRRRPPAGPFAMTAAAASSPICPKEARPEHPRGQGALGRERAATRPACPGVRHLRRTRTRPSGREHVRGLRAGLRAGRTPPRRSWSSAIAVAMWNEIRADRTLVEVMARDPALPPRPRLRSDAQEPRARPLAQHRTPLPDRRQHGDPTCPARLLPAPQGQAATG